VDTVLAGSRVLFNGFAAPLLFLQAGQINALVPFEVAGQTNVRLEFEQNGTLYDAIDLRLTDAAPALFTSDASGHAQGAILNENGTPNSVIRPGKKGSIVVLYASGGGRFDRPVQTGAITGTDLAGLVLPTKAQVDGVDAEILYCGSAPGMVAGVIQVNIRLPQQIRSEGVPVVVEG
jgi:uncharacterized protein (TIGR03437 family)